MTPRSVLRHSSWIAIASLAAAFGGAMLVPRIGAEIARPVLPFLVAVAVGAAFVSGLLSARTSGGRRVALVSAVTPAALVATGFSLFLIVGGRPAQIAVAVTVLALSVIYGSYLQGVASGHARFSTADFAHLSFAVHVTTVFFAFAFGLGIRDYVQAPLAAVAAPVAAVVLFATAETLRRSGVRGKEAAMVSIAFTLLAAELCVALAFLPTGALVDAAVAVTLYAGGLYAAIEVLTNPVGAPRLRRQMALSFSLVAVVLCTARWN